jgi:hypothetical protein
MKVAFRFFVGLIVVVALLLGVATIYVRSTPDDQEVLEFEKSFKLIQIGDPETKALSVLGKPDAKEKEFRLGQKKGFEDAYARAEASDSTYYLLWFKGIDVVFSVGINNKGQVSAKESGGT